jgi:hypothetical protein
MCVFVYTHACTLLPRAFAEEEEMQQGEGEGEREREKRRDLPPTPWEYLFLTIRWLSPCALQRFINNMLLNEISRVAIPGHFCSAEHALLGESYPSLWYVFGLCCERSDGYSQPRNLKLRVLLCEENALRAFDSGESESEAEGGSGSEGGSDTCAASPASMVNKDEQHYSTRLRTLQQMSRIWRNQQDHGGRELLLKVAIPQFSHTST